MSTFPSGFGRMMATPVYLPSVPSPAYLAPGSNLYAVSCKNEKNKTMYIGFFTFQSYYESAKKYVLVEEIQEACIFTDKEEIKKAIIQVEKMHPFDGLDFLLVELEVVKDSPIRKDMWFKPAEME